MVETVVLLALAIAGLAMLSYAMPIMIMPPHEDDKDTEGYLVPVSFFGALFTMIGCFGLLDKISRFF